MWYKEEECKQIIKKRWYNSCEVNETNILKTLQTIGKDLIKWNKNKVGKVKEEIKSTRNELENMKLEPPNENNKKEVELSLELEEYLGKEEDMCRQKSRELCLREGDKNTKYFYSFTINRRRINIIYKIKNKDGKWN